MTFNYQGGSNGNAGSAFVPRSPTAGFVVAFSYLIALELHDVILFGNWP
jgi:hypothetical protein